MVVCGQGGVDVGCKYNLDEDASYYAEIEKQILELMADDGVDDIVHFGRKARGYSDSAQVDRRSDVVVSYSLPPWNFFKMSSSGGTGVFIPQIVNRSTTSESPSDSETKNWSGRSRRCRRKGKREEPQLVGFQVAKDKKSPVDCLIKEQDNRRIE